MFKFKIKGNVKLISILAATAVILTLIICLFACSGAKKTSDAEQPTEAAKDETPTETDTSVYTAPIYQSPPAENEETSEEETTTEEVTTEAPREKSLAFTSNGNGTCTVTGLGDITDSCIIIPEKSPDGEVVTGIGDKAFYGNISINAVQIPSTVTHIGNMAFGGCTSLIYISVNKDNKSFTDVNGILFSADMEKLIHYPALKGDDTLTLQGTLTSILDMAFYNCSALKYINFDGTMSEWASVRIGELNYGLFAVAVSCKDSK